MKTEDKKNSELDFPFYKDNPKVKVKDIIILAFTPIFFTLYTFLDISLPYNLGAYLFCLIPLAAFLYVAKGNISLIIKKPKFRDFIRVIITVILHFIVAIVTAMIFRYVLKIGITDNPVSVNMENDIVVWIAIIFQLFGEELYKLLIFLVALILIYRKTKKEKLSIALSTIISLLCFGIIHLTTYNNLIQVLVIQGALAIFCAYNYLKTKNIMMAYLEHLLFDAIPFILAIMNIV